MARTDKTDTGKWVARAAATGGSRSYRGQRPMKWYASLVFICLLGVALIVYSRYERQHPTSTPPAVGTQWFAAVAWDVCGSIQPDLPQNPNLATNPGIATPGLGVISIAPTKAKDAGANATLGRFVDSYPGLVLTPNALRLPGKSKSTHHNGETCATGTPDAGKAGTVQVRVWPSFTATGSLHSGDPASLKLANGQLITVAFVPAGAPIPKPSSRSIAAMQQGIQASQNPSSTTTTTLPSTATTVAPNATSTTAPVTTTTTAGTSSTTSK